MAIAVTAAGCGSSSSSTTAPLSKSQFVAKANAICEKGNRAINKAVGQAFGKTKASSSQLQQFAMQTVIPNIQQQTTAVEALQPPSADADQVKAITAAAQQALDKARSDPSLFTQPGNTVFAQADKLSKAYGLDQCTG